MAKALLGHLNCVPRTPPPPADDNRRPRRGVEYLEALDRRLPAHHDRLAAAARDEQLTVEDLQPV